MKNIFYSLILGCLVACFGKGIEKWHGEYSYIENEVIGYTLTIDEDARCIYEGEGIQTFFKVECEPRVDHDSLKIYFVKTLDGAFYPKDWMNKELPIMTLYYQDNILYTDEGQLNKEVKGGQILFKKR